MEDLQEEDKMEKKKITQLHLNTPGACFLCLQDNERDDEGDPVDHLNGGIIDLTNICRYLNIDQFSLLLTACKNDGGDAAGGVEDIVCTFSVNLCFKCLELTEKLNDKIIALEKAKLMVNFQLHCFHKILEGKKKEESGERFHLQEKINTNLENSLEAKLVQLLRKEVQQKSFKFLKKAEAAMPQIILSKCQVPPSQEPPRLSEPPLLPESPSPPSSLPAPSPEELLPSSERPQIPSTPSAGTSSSIKTLLNHLVTTSVIPSKKSRKSKLPLCRCPYCAKILTHPKLTLHLSCLHSDKLLSSHFLPPSQPPSEQICRQALHPKLIGHVVKIQPSSRSRWACHICGINYGHCSLLKHHFLLTHTSLLCEEIASKSSLVSKSVNNFIKQLLETSLLISLPNNGAKVIERNQCPFCGIYFLYSNFAPHLANLHPDKLLDPFTPSIGKERDDNPNYFRQLCSRVLATQVAKAARIRGASSASSRSSKLCCHLCASEYLDGQDLKHHFVVHHADNLCEQLIKMQNVKIRVKKKSKKKKILRRLEMNKLGEKTTSPSCLAKLQLQTLKRRAQAKKKKPLKKISRSLEERTCTICRKVFPQFDKLRRHQATHHPDQLFLECKPDWMGGDQFRETCKEMFRREVGAPCEGYNRCGYCPEGKKSYLRQRDLVVHLAYQHRREMEKMLKQDCEEKQENEQDGRGDHMVIEENASGFDVKRVEIGELDLGLDELIMEHQYGLFEEDIVREVDNEVDGGMMIRNMKEEQVELSNQSAPSSSQDIKMEVNGN